jgi:hypothetical protein
MAMDAGEVAEVAEVDLQCLQSVKLYIDRIDFLKAFFEGSCHAILLRSISDERAGSASPLIMLKEQPHPRS